MTMTSAGTTFGVSATMPSTADEAGYAALTYTNTGQIESIEELGKEYTETNFVALDNRRTQKYKGSYDNGSFSLSLARTPGDAGQAVLRDALNSDKDYAFRIMLQDGTTMYFGGKVMSYTTEIGDADAITMSSVQVGISTDIIETTATVAHPGQDTNTLTTSDGEQLTTSDGETLRAA